MPMLTVISGGRDSPCRPEKVLHLPELDEWPRLRDFVQVWLAALTDEQIEGNGDMGPTTDHEAIAIFLSHLAQAYRQRTFTDAMPEAIKAIEAYDGMWDADRLLAKVPQFTDLHADATRLTSWLHGASASDRYRLRTTFVLAWLAGAERVDAQRVLGNNDYRPPPIMVVRSMTPRRPSS